MKVVVFSAVAVLLIACFSHPYLTRATEKPGEAYASTPATTPSLVTAAWKDADLPSLTLPFAFKPLPTMESAYPQIRGHAGYWRLAQDQAGVWWYLSPANQAQFLNTVTTVQPYQFSRDRFGPHFISRDWNGGDTAKGDLDGWAQATAQRVMDVGFKGLGAWCNPAFHKLNIPMTQDLNVWTWINDNSKRFYQPDWQAMADLAIKTQVSPLADNKSLVGYFIDNELDWGDDFAGPSAYFDHLPIGDPNRQEVLKVIHSIWHTVDDFNLGWNTKHTHWTEVDGLMTLPKEPSSAYTRLGNAWLAHLARDYFSTTTSLIRKYDPNHLILGVRFKGYAPEAVVKASRNLTDAQSLNYYVGDAQLDADMFRMMYAESGQPIVISEYSFHSLDGRSGNRDTVGFSAQVPDQQARADGYRLMTTRLARVPYIVGADWFQWCDEPPGGRGNDGEDVNFGVVDIDDRPYDKLVDAIRQTTPLLNPLHAASMKDSEQDVWRESYATKPVMHVPFLKQPPVLNGELSDWLPASKLAGMRREQTVGLDRCKVPTPNIFLGWTRDGLYCGMEVYDSQILAAPAKGWWWTRDHVEFWLSSKPVTSDQTEYDTSCHQFFFVPTDFANNDGVAGVVGQWHRDGDALADHLIPHPDIKSAVRILPDRYVVEMFIPASALHGFDPIRQPALAFNIHVRDFQSAADFFWSAPKSVQTQIRPNTWGALYLDPPPAAPAINTQARLE